VILAIDPGPSQSAYVLSDGARVIEHDKLDNDDVIDAMGRPPLCDAWHLAIEMVASYGMPVGADVFTTCVWIGKFAYCWQSLTGHDAQLVYRKDVLLHLCNKRNAKDANVRQALIDRFGPGKDKAIGLKKSPGPLYGVSGDVWSALAVAVTTADERAKYGAVAPDPMGTA
jgi:hypothetical protein